MVTKLIENIIDYFSTEEGVPLSQDLLAEEKVPRKIVFLEKLPKTRTGKIKRRELHGYR